MHVFDVVEEEKEEGKGERKEGSFAAGAMGVEATMEEKKSRVFYQKIPKHVRDM